MFQFGMHRAGQEAHQRARPFGEQEAEQPLVVRQLAAPAHHVAHVLLGQLVVVRSTVLEAVALRRCRAIVFDSPPRRGLVMADDADEDVGLVGVADAVVEFRDLARLRPAGPSVRKSA